MRSGTRTRSRDDVGSGRGTGSTTHFHDIARLPLRRKAGEALYKRYLRDDLMTTLTFLAFACVEGRAFVASQRRKRGLIEDALELY
jgi:hypothetical protein